MQVLKIMNSSLHFCISEESMCILTMKVETNTSIILTPHSFSFRLGGYPGE